MISIDKSSPVISGMPPSGCKLWPPNQKLVQVGTVTVADALAGVAAGSLTVTGQSNEPNESINPTIVIQPDGSGGFVVQLQANRLASGGGRIYVVTATATDLAGNLASATSTCTVPHDQGK
jgi:hypothetical protein